MSESSNKKVVALHGAAPTGGEPLPEIVTLLESWLAEAKRGQIAGLMIAGIDGSGLRVVTDFNGGRAQKAYMLYGADILHRRIQDLCIQDSYVIPRESA